MANTNEVTFKIVERIAVLATSETGWSKELNRVAWNGGVAKFDIRQWDSSHQKMGRGITLSAEEMEIICGALADRF